MDYTILLNEIQSGPLADTLAPLMAAGNDQAIANVLNDKSLGGTLVDALTIPDLIIFLASTGMRAKLKAGLQHANPGVVSICETALEMLTSSRFTYFDPAETYTAAMLDALVAAGVITADDLDTLVSRATRPASRAEQVLGRGVTVNHLDVARAQGNY